MEINITYCIISVVILVLLLIRQLKVWKFRVLMSPGFYFAAFWILGVLGVTLFATLNMIPVVYPEYIDELNILVGFTGLCFLLFTKWGRNKVNEDTIRINFTTRTVFNTLSIILLFAAFYDFIRLGGNLNMGAAREAVHENVSTRATWIGYIETLSLPLSMYAGYKLFNILIYKKTETLVGVLFLILPLFSNLIFSINVGGRVHFIYAFIYYLVGAAFAVPLNKPIAKLKKPLFMLAISSLILLSFISSVAAQRTEYYRGKIDEKQAYFESEYGMLSFLYGPVEYMMITYVGYQFRRDDAVDLDELGYGRYAFNGFINWTLPFAGQLGMEDVSIANAFDIYYDNQETYDFERIAYNCTHSLYIPLVKDFGNSTMLYVVIAIISFISHYLFVQIQRKEVINKACSLFLYYLFWIYWVKSNYYGTLSSSVLIPFYGFVIIDIVGYFSKEKQY